MLRLFRYYKKILAIVLIIICGFGVYFIEEEATQLSASAQQKLNEESGDHLQQLFAQRNAAMLAGDDNQLKTLFDTKIRTSLWAYQHESKKMSYLKAWTDKQGIRLTKIESDIVVKSSKPKGDGFTATVLVSTQYNYAYENEQESSNYFRLGAYHSIECRPTEQGWVVAKEWYEDPLEDTISLDPVKKEQIKALILSGVAKDLSTLKANRKAAVAYADQYCGAAGTKETDFKYNSKYQNYSPKGGDCANFASQVIFEGGKFKKNGAWNYDRGAGSITWIKAYNFNNYMRGSGRASLITYGSYEKVLKLSYNLLPGDYIAYEKKGDVAHISVVTGLDSKGYPLVNSHTADRCKVPWDLGWNEKGIKFYLVRVHY